MNVELIKQTSAAAIAGTMNFSDAVAQLLSAGVEYFHVDYVCKRKTYYSADGEVVTMNIPYEDLPAVSADFDAETLKAVIKDSQYNGQRYQEFSRRAIAAGVQGYFAFLRVKHVTYWGRNGEQHTEWFPGADPSLKAA